VCSECWHTQSLVLLSVSYNFRCTEATKMEGLNNNRHSVGQNAYHLVWKPKYAFPIFELENLRQDCEAILLSIAKQWSFDVYELKVMSDHVHLFIECPPTISVSKALQIFKGGSAYRLFKKHPSLRKYKNFYKGHFWSPGKFFRSVGNVTAETIQHYIAESNNGWNFYQKRRVTSFA
jgi:putative transposase